MGCCLEDCSLPAPADLVDDSGGELQLLEVLHRGLPVTQHPVHLLLKASQYGGVLQTQEDRSSRIKLQPNNEIANNSLKGYVELYVLSGK